MHSAIRGSQWVQSWSQHILHTPVLMCGVATWTPRFTPYRPKTTRRDHVGGEEYDGYMSVMVALGGGFRSYKVFFPYFGDLLDGRLLELVFRGCLGKCGPAEVECVDLEISWETATPFIPILFCNSHTPPGREHLARQTPERKTQPGIIPHLPLVGSRRNESL